MSNTLNIVKLKIVDFFSKNVVKKVCFFVLLFCVIWASWSIFVPLAHQASDNLQTIRTVMIVPIVGAIGALFYFVGKRTLTLSKFMIIMMVIGCTLRIGYAFYTGSNTRQHDVEMYSGSSLNLNGYGHFSYIYTIYSTWHLPTVMEWQFYHPPLWHSFAAIWMHVEEAFTSNHDVAFLFQSVEILSSYFACITLYFLSKLSIRLVKNKYAAGMMIFFLALFPQFIVMAGWVNNDGCAFMFSVIALFFAVRYLDNRNWVNIICSGIALGCAGMSKVSSALVAIPMLVIFIKSIIDAKKDHTAKKTLIHGAVFIIIVLVLAGWFLLRNAIKFGVVSLGVPSLDPSSDMCVSSYSFAERFILIPFNHLNDDLFCILHPTSSGYLDYNVWIYTFKCALFGEYSYWQGMMFGYIGLYSNIALVALIIFAVIYMFIREVKTEHFFMNLTMLITFVSVIVAYVIFQILYPFTCTQDFRYMVLILVPAGYFLARLYIRIKGKKRAIPFYIITLIFLVNSILFYLSCR